MWYKEKSFNEKDAIMGLLTGILNILTLFLTVFMIVRVGDYVALGLSAGLDREESNTFFLYVMTLLVCVNIQYL